jgi:hypothetical protein
VNARTHRQWNRRVWVLASIGVLLTTHLSCSDMRSGSQQDAGKAAPSLVHRDAALWSQQGWTDLRWGMGPADAIPRLRADGGESWRASDEDRNALGLATDLAHMAVLKSSVHGHAVAAVLKFSDARGLLGVLLLTPPDGGVSRWRCSKVFESLQAALKGELGPGKDGVSFISGTPRTEWLSDKMRMKLTQELKTAGCVVQMSYVDPDIYKD